MNQTFDGGNKWGVRTFGALDVEEEINYRFQKVEEPPHRRLFRISLPANALEHIP